MTKLALTPNNHSARLIQQIRYVDWVDDKLGFANEYTDEGADTVGRAESGIDWFARSSGYYCLRHSHGR